jgi:hypothetical protein
MKTISCLVTVISAALLAGCGQKSSDAPGETGAATKEIQKAATTVAKEAAPAVKTQAKEAFANLGQQLVQATKGGSADALVKNISTDLETRVTKLAQSLTTNQVVQQQLNTSVQALLGNKDIDAISTLNQLTAAQLTPEQTTLAKEVYNATAALVTQRNFSAIEGMNSDVAQLATAVWKGDYKQAVTPLQKLYGQSTLTSAQKNLLSTTFDAYMPARWKEAAGTIQQGVDSLKKLGL